MVRTQRDGSVIVDGSITIRELNRVTDWQLPTQGPKTLSGFITNYLERIPQSGVACRIHDYPMEIIKANEHTIQLVQVWPMQKRVQSH
jgi:Mg2+/Co2+ transporter CorB